MDELQVIHIKIPSDMYRALKRQMRRNNKPMSALVRDAIAEWLEQRGDIVDPSVTWGGFRDDAKPEDATNAEAHT